MIPHSSHTILKKMLEMYFKSINIKCCYNLKKLTMLFRQNCIMLKINLMNLKDNNKIFLKKKKLYILNVNPILYILSIYFTFTRSH